MSQVTAIYQHLAGMELTIGDKTPAVYSLASLLQKVETAQLPARLLAVTGGRSGGQDGQFQTLRTVLTVRWQLTDLLLYKPEAQGRGLSDVAAQLVAYAGDYLEAVKANRKPLPAGVRSTAQVMAARVTPGVYEWPERSGTWYFGVECVLDIDEIL
jgi:hypothetical protein